MLDFWSAFACGFGIYAIVVTLCIIALDKWFK